MKFLFNVLKDILYLIFQVINICERIAGKKQAEITLSRFSSVGEKCEFQYNDYCIRGLQFIKVGDHFSVGRCFRMEAINEYDNISYSPEIIIGNNVRIEDYCHIGCVERVVIGDGVLIASKVFITDHFHGDISRNDLKKIPKERPLNSKPVVIGNNVWIGDSVSIMPGVTLGNNVIVGANAVVTHSFPADVVIAGCPAKVIKTLGE